MGSVKNPRAKWVLPNVVHPETSTCYIVPVPDDPFYRAAFFGALQGLASAYKWQDDLTHQAREVALVWREIADNLQICSEPEPIPSQFDGEIEDCMKLRIHPDDPCIIQIECADGDWQDWYNPKECIAGIVAQPSEGGGELPAGACFEYEAYLNAKERWLLPVPVNEGDIITISGHTGAWHAGEFQWYCQSGHAFALGICGAGSFDYEAGDPLPADPHMSLIMGDGTDYWPAYDTVWVAPSGMSDAQITFQANDDPLTDNSGNVAFHVKICKPATGPFAVTYTMGTGPSTMEVGGIYRLDSTHNADEGGYENIVVNFSQCHKFRILAYGGMYVLRIGATNKFLRRVCGGGAYVNGGAVVAGDNPVNTWPATIPTEVYGAPASVNGNPFWVTIEVLGD